MPDAVSRATNNYYFKESQQQEEFDRVQYELEDTFEEYVDRFKDIMVEELGKSETAKELLDRLVITIEID